MRVLQVIDTLKVGGAEQMTVFISNLLKSHDVEVTVLVLVEKGDLINELDKNIPLVFLNRQKRFSINKLKAIAKLLDQFDIVHIHLKHNYRYVALASKYFSNKRHKLLFHDHSHYHGISKFSLRMLKDGLFKSVFKPQYFIGVNNVNCSWAKSNLKLPNQNVFLLENTIAKKDIQRTNIDRQGIIVTSNISRVKNIEFAIELAHTLNENLTIYGKIRDEDYFGELNQLIERLNYAEHIKFVHNCNDIQSELHNYKFAIHTSFRETGPLVLIEYLAQGLPFVAHASGQVYATLKDELPVYFVSNLNLDSWLTKIKELDINSTDLLKETYNTYFSSDNYINKCLKIYQSILNS